MKIMGIMNLIAPLFQLLYKFSKKRNPITIITNTNYQHHPPHNPLPTELVIDIKVINTSEQALTLDSCEIVCCPTLTKCSKSTSFQTIDALKNTRINSNDKVQTHHFIRNLSTIEPDKDYYVAIHDTYSLRTHYSRIIIPNR